MLRTAARPRRLVSVLGGTTSHGDCMAALRHLANPRRLIRGSAIAEYERAFARQVGVRYGYSFSSGRVGLYGLLRVLGVGDGDEVLLGVPTHIVVSNAIRYTGAQPVYVDCRREDYNMDLAQAERRLTSRTKVLVLQHTFGIPADLDAALALACRHNLVLIEDCVHALGATYKGRQVGSFGQAAFFSTEETKTISTTMGGMVVTDDPEVAAGMLAFQEGCAWTPASLTARYLAKLVVYHLATQPYVHPYTRRAYELLGRRHPLPGATTGDELRGLRPAGYEQRLSNAQAELGLRQLRRLGANLAHRRELTDLYGALLSVRGYRLHDPPAGAEPALVRYPVWVPDRTEAQCLAAPHALLGNSWFTSVLEEAASPAHGGYEPGSCPCAEAASRHLINLPLHPRTTVRDAERIALSLPTVGPARSTRATWQRK